MAALETLASCLCAQISVDNNGAGPCFCGVLPGEGIAVDLTVCEDEPDGECGMAYVRLSTIYPSTVVGQLDLSTGNCGAGQGFDVEVGIFRCFPLPEDGSAPDPGDLLEATTQQIADARTMWTTLSCCGWLDDQKAFVMGQYVPVGPSGGVIGGVFPVSAWLP